MTHNRSVLGVPIQMAVLLVALVGCRLEHPPVGPATPAPDRPGAQQPGQVRPMDALTAGEREAAARIALGDARVREIIAGRQHDVSLVELFVPKPDRPFADDADRPPPLARQAEVLVSVFERGFTGIRALVDLQTRAVVDVQRLEDRPEVSDALAGGTVVPISPCEVEITEQLVRAHPGFRAVLGAAREAVTLEYLPITSPEPGFCPSGRCLEVLFREGNAYHTTTAVVDILRRSVQFRRPER